MKKIKMVFGTLSILIALLGLTVAANAETVTVTGKVTGFECMTKGITCPIDKADPMINVEKDFVLVTAAGDYYFMPNLTLGLKARHALETVTVTGDLNSKFKTITVKTLSVAGKEFYNKKAEDDWRMWMQER
jgi:hypothetical protein